MARHSQKNTALVIDDEPGVCIVLKRFFQSFHLGAIACNTAEEGLRLLDGADADYGIVILDYRLLGTQGPSCYREIRKRRADIPVLIITAYASQPDLEEILREPRTALLNKPFSIDQFRNAITKLAPGFLSPQEPPGA
jgi:DNA-binding NtrC family response regulator